MNTLDYLAQHSAIASRYAWALDLGLKEIETLGVIDEHKVDALTYEDLKILEMVTSRFSKLQDHIGGKIFPLLLNIVGNDAPKQTFIDMLNKLEKIGFLEDAYPWKDLRDLKNDVAHEYAYTSKELAEKINEVIKASHFLLGYCKELQKKIEDVKSKLVEYPPFFL